MRKMTVHWRLHPHKDEHWYARQQQRMSEDEVARELDISYALSVSGKVFSPFRNELHVSSTRWPVDPRLPVYRIWDFGMTNAVLYGQVDMMGRKRIHHERVLGGGVTPSNTQEQIQVALRDSTQLFPNALFIDICDPAGSYEDHRGATPDVEALQQEGIDPEYDTILHLPSKDRKRRGRQLILRDLQHCPGGEPGLMLFSPEPGTTGPGSDMDPEHGCPILKQAFQSEYRYKTDHFGHIIDTIVEKHPYEDVMDCLIYWALVCQNDLSFVDDTNGFQPKPRVIYQNTDWNEFTGY